MAPIKKSTLFIGVVVVAGLLAAVKFFLPSKTESEPTMATTSTETNKQAKEVSVTTMYNNPGGKDSVKFSLFVDSTGTIVDAKVGVLATNMISKTRQTAFAEGLPTTVKGKKLSELSAIDRVGGSSLTTKAFNDSLAELKAAL